MNDLYVAVKVTSRGIAEIGIHLPDVSGSHATLCGLDGDDENEESKQECVDVPAGARVNCPQCYAIWRVATKYRQTDFVWRHGRE